MGHIPDPTHYKLTFPDRTPADGSDPLVVVARSMSVLEALDFDDLRFAPVTTAAENRAKTMGIAETLAKILVSWNLEAAPGQPVPMTVDGILGQDDKLVEGIVAAWRDAVAGVSVPLAGPSLDGANPSPLEASIPMEALPPSPAS